MGAVGGGYLSVGAVVCGLVLWGVGAAPSGADDGWAGESSWDSPWERGLDEREAGGGSGGDDRDVETYGDWSLHCVTGRASLAGRPRCHVWQRIFDHRTERTIVAMQLRAPDPDGRATAFVRVPLGILLGEGVVMSVDGRAPARIGVRTCLPEGCVLRLGLSPARIAAMRAGRTLRFDMRNGRGQHMVLRLSLMGFSKAYDSLLARTDD